MNKITERLNKLGFNAHDFCYMLRETKTIMAGSFPLQCILDKNFEESDIDLYCHKDILDRYPAFGQWLYFNTKGCQRPSKRDYPAYVTIKHLIYMVEYHTPLINIQIMIVDDDIDLKDFVEEYFDLSFCKVVCDGNNVTVSDKQTFDYKGTLNTKYLSSDFDAYDYVFYRMQKYERRGFTITNKNDYKRGPRSNLYDDQKRQEQREYYERQREIYKWVTSFKDKLVIEDRKKRITDKCDLVIYRLLGIDGESPHIPQIIRQYIIYCMRRNFALGEAERICLTYQYRDVVRLFSDLSN